MISFQLCKSRKSLCQEPDHFSIFQSIRKQSCQGCSGREQDAVEQHYSLGFAHSQQSSLFFCLNWYFWLWQSDWCHSSALLGLSKQIKAMDGNIRTRRSRCPKWGLCWEFAEGEMKLGLCEFKLGRTLQFLINWWILQRFHFISIKDKCFYCKEAEQSTLCVPLHTGVSTEPPAAEGESLKSRASCCFIALVKIGICTF